jgi:hypothetical protein
MLLFGWTSIVLGLVLQPCGWLVAFEGRLLELGSALIISSFMCLLIGGYALARRWEIRKASASGGMA